MKDIIIYGNSVGVLVTALELSKEKNNNIILINPNKNWGGYFGGILINDIKFDIGMNLFEFTSYLDKENIDILNYNPSIKSESGKYSNLILEYVKKIIPTHFVETPKIYWDDKYFNDYYISNSLEILNEISIEDKKIIKSELNIILKNTEKFHAKFKNTNSEKFYKYDLFTVSKLNHGSFFHEKFIDPLIIKILNIESNKIPSILHRIPWAPLYYPETLLNKLLNNNISQIQQSVFEYPDLSTFSKFSDNIFDLVKTKKNVKLFNDKITDIDFNKNSIHTESNVNFDFDNLILGCDIVEYYTLCNKNQERPIFEKANFIFIFCRLATVDVIKKFSVLFINDENIPIYRITNQTILEGKNSDFTDLIFEINADYFKNKFNTSIELIVHESLLKLKIVNTYNPIFQEIRNFDNAVNLPTFNNLDLYNKLKEKIVINKNLHFIGNITSLFANSFNDNIIQALQITKIINNDFKR